MRPLYPKWLILYDVQNVLYRDAVLDANILLISQFADRIGCRYICGLSESGSPIFRFSIRPEDKVIQIRETCGNLLVLPVNSQDVGLLGELTVSWDKNELIVFPKEMGTPIRWETVSKPPKHINLLKLVF